MGARGPQPTPTALLAARGSWRAKHRVNHGEPMPERAIPSCPSYLGKAERQVWRQLAKELASLGLLTRIDRNPLARYCVLFVRWRKACDFIEKYGTTMPVKAVRPAGKNPDGGILFEEYVKCFIPMPQVNEESNLRDGLLKLEREFGLTPAARTRIRVDLPEDTSSDKSRFFQPRKLSAG